jgi:hypothetical protein
MSDELIPMSLDLCENGIAVAIVHSVPSATIEAWIRAVRGWARVEVVDWGFIGGRAVVSTLGTPEEVERVREACASLLPALDAILPGLFPELRGDSLSAGIVIKPRAAE